MKKFFTGAVILCSVLLIFTACDVTFSFNDAQSSQVASESTENINNNSSVNSSINSKPYVPAEVSKNSTSYDTSTKWTVKGTTNYLALRTAPAYDASNIIGQLYNNDYVYLVSYDNYSDTYWYVYSPTLDKYGYVNSNYIYTGDSTPISYDTSTKWTVKGTTNYLALRTAPAYDASNIIGQLYNNDYVYLVSYDNYSDTYWYVYSPTLDKYGYVNSNYIYTGDSTPISYDTSTKWTVKGTTNYLALRTAPAYDASNIIGQLYNNDYVYLVSYDNYSDTYWYVYSPTLDKYGYVNSNYIYS